MAAGSRLPLDVSHPAVVYSRQGPSVPNPEDGHPQHQDHGQVLLLDQARGTTWCIGPGYWIAAQSLPSGRFSTTTEPTGEGKMTSVSNVPFNFSISQHQGLFNVGDLLVQNQAIMSRSGYPEDKEGGKRRRMVALPPSNSCVQPLYDVMFVCTAACCYLFVYVNQHKSK